MSSFSVEIIHSHIIIAVQIDRWQLESLSSWLETQIDTARIGLK
jgi:hypothetical protein